MKSKMKFKTDGIRGIPNFDFNSSDLNLLGASLSIFNKNVVIATDTRISKDFMTSSITSGILSVGLNVYNAGILSTPALMYYSYKYNLTGVMVTASHNPFYDNGIKIFNSGYKLTVDEQKKIEEFENTERCMKFGRIFYTFKPYKIYLKHLNNYIIKSNKKIMIDASNGATYKIVGDVFNKISSDVHIISNKPNGYNINNKCGSVHINNLVKEMKEYNYDIGFSFDGDGDRVICVLDDGTILDGTMILYIIAKFLKNKGLLNNGVALSKQTNIGIIESLKKNNINTIITDIGDKYINEAIVNNKLSLGAETSGHVIIPSFFHGGDGILTALVLLKIMEVENVDFKEQIKDVKLWPVYNLNVNVNSLYEIKEEVFKKIEILKKKNKDAYILVRKSGTENKVRISVMSKDFMKAKILAYKIKKML